MVVASQLAKLADKNYLLMQWITIFIFHSVIVTKTLCLSYWFARMYCDPNLLAPPCICQSPLAAVATSTVGCVYVRRDLVDHNQIENTGEKGYQRVETDVFIDHRGGSSRQGTLSKCRRLLSRRAMWCRLRTTWYVSEKIFAAPPVWIISLLFYVEISVSQITIAVLPIEGPNDSALVPLWEGMALNNVIYCARN